MKKQNGITLIALVISIIVMLILAGVSINAILGEDGVLTKAQNAKLASEEAARLEELELILLDYNTSEFLGESDGFGTYMNSLIDQGVIENFLMAGEDIITQYEGNWYGIVQSGEFYEIGTKMSDPTEGGGDSNMNFIITPENATGGTVNFQAGGSYLVLDNITADDFNFSIPAGEAVTIKLTGDMKIDNKGYKRSAIDLAKGATLNLHVYGDIEVNSGYGEDGQGLVPGKGGYAGIHVPEGATLNLYGNGSIKAIGGNAGDGSYIENSRIGGAGGGGAGAGIGGHGGTGGVGADGVGKSGETGENCGNINIYNSITVYAYGGEGGSGARGTLSSGTVDGASGSGGGYPSAGIGGGGAGGAGGSCCSGGGGYSGGTGEYNDTYIAVNGNNGSHGENLITYQGGGYFKGGDSIFGTIERNKILGGFAGIGTDLKHLAGNGGTAGKGGNVKVSSTAKVYAYNGNRYTDGTSYENGKNQCPIYAQNGIKLAQYRYLSASEIVLNSAQSTINTLSYINKAIADSDKKLTIDSNISILTNIDMTRQGIGSGAGYIEVSNGTYIVDSSMN